MAREALNTNRLLICATGSVKVRNAHQRSPVAPASCVQEGPAASMRAVPLNTRVPPTGVALGIAWEPPAPSMPPVPAIALGGRLSPQAAARPLVRISNSDRVKKGARISIAPPGRTAYPETPPA